MELTEIARELFECLTKRIYTPELDAELGLTDRERLAIEAFLDLEGEQEDEQMA